MMNRHKATHRLCWLMLTQFILWRRLTVSNRLHQQRCKVPSDRQTDRREKSRSFFLICLCVCSGNVLIEIWEEDKATFRETKRTSGCEDGNWFVGMLRFGSYSIDELFPIGYAEFAINFDIYTKLLSNREWGSAKNERRKKRRLLSCSSSSSPSSSSSACIPDDNSNIKWNFSIFAHPSLIGIC